MDTSLGGVRHPATGQDLSVEDAVMAGVLDIPRASYNNALDDNQTGLANGHANKGQDIGHALFGSIGGKGSPAFGTRGMLNGHVDSYGDGDGEVDSVGSVSAVIPIAEAVAENKVNPKTAKKIYAAMSKMALGEALMQSQIDPVTGKFIHPDTKAKMSIADAIEEGLLDPYATFFVDPESGQVTSLGAFIDEGKFNPVTGKFKDPATGLEVSMNSAIKKGIIEPHIDPDKFIEMKCPLKELLDAGKISQAGAVFLTPDGQEISLKDALTEGFITPDSMIRVDPKTAQISAVDEGSSIIKVRVAVDRRHKVPENSSKFGPRDDVDFISLSNNRAVFGSILICFRRSA